MQIIKVGNKLIGFGKPTFIVAEVGFNHNGNPLLAKKMIIAAAKSGADAIKFQTFKAEKLSSKYVTSYGVKGENVGKSQWELYKPFELPDKAYPTLIETSKKHNIIFFSSPFDEGSADLLDKAEVPLFKIASCDLTHLNLIKHIAQKKKPVIISTGMGTMAEIKEAVSTCLRAGNKRIILLHCTSNYPTDPKNANLNAITSLKENFPDIPIGFSDHTRDNYAAFAAVSMGSCLVEKHFTLDKKMPGVDQHFSMDPPQLADLVRGIRTIEKAKGKFKKEPLRSENITLKLARPSVILITDLVAGVEIKEEMLAIKRPGTGILPKELKKVVGKKTKIDIKAETPLTWKMIDY